jgi:hypothetical protein
MSIYGGQRGWSELNEVVQPVVRHPPAETAPRAEAARPAADWSMARKAQPANFLFPQSRKWLEALPPEVAPSALATEYPRIVNIIVSQWSDPLGVPELFEELLGDRRGGRAGFPPAVRRDLLNLQEFWYSGHAPLK